MPRSPFDVALDAPFLAVPYPLIQKLGIAKASLLALLLARRRMVHDRFGLKEGEWFYVKADEISEKLKISKTTQRDYTNQMVEDGLIEKQLMGAPPKLYFRISMDMLGELYSDWDEDQRESKTAESAVLRQRDPALQDSEIRRFKTARSGAFNKEDREEEDRGKKKDLAKSKESAEADSSQGFGFEDGPRRFKRGKRKNRRAGSSFRKVDRELAEELRRLWMEKGPRVEGNGRRRVPLMITLAEEVEWLHNNRLSAENIRLAIEWAKEHYDDKYCAMLSSVDKVPAIILKWHKQQARKNGSSIDADVTELMRKRT